VVKKYLLLICIVFIGVTTYAQDVEQLAIFSGQYDYTAFGNTMNTVENGAGGPCTILTESSATLSLNPDQTVVAAYLYWAGSGTGDTEVLLNGVPLTAERVFADQIDPDRVFFAAFVDVTTQVQNTGPGLYTLGELDLTNDIIPYCPTGTNFAGWAITVIYEDSALPLNQVNVFDGLQSVSQTQFDLTIELENLNVIDNEDAKIGFVAWEGDAGIAVQETLTINGSVLSNPPLNPADNQFNGTNSFTGASDLFNMDIDVYDIENNIEIGDTSATIMLTSGQDFVMINNIITVLNSTLPDAIIAIDEVDTQCQSRTIEVTYTVTNQGTEPLPSGTPIAFYVDADVVGASATAQAVGIDESITETALVTIPTSIPDDFQLIAVVDDTGNGSGIVNELDEENNTSDPFDVSLNAIDVESPPQDFIVCDDPSNDGEAIFDLTVNGDAAVGAQTGISVSYHLSSLDAENGNNPISNPENYTNTASPQSIFMRLELDVDPSCFSVLSFVIEVTIQPDIAALIDVEVCDDDSNDGVAVFDLNFQNEVILGTQTGLDISFHNSLDDAQQGSNPISNASSYSNVTNPETIFVRLNNPRSLDCFDTASYEIAVDDIAFIDSPLQDFIICDDPSNDGVEVFDFTPNAILATGSQSDVMVTFHTSQTDADTGDNPIATPASYTNTSNPQTIFLRIIQDQDDDCFSTTSFVLEIFEQPTVPLLETLSICDDASNDGLSVFDLTSQESLILQGQSSFVVSYHLTQNEAITNSNAIQNPMAFANSSAFQDIYVRLENPLQPACADFGIIPLEVLPIAPIINLADISLCNEGFERAVFDLSQNIDDLNLAPDEQIEGYYLNTIDALEQINPIADPFAYTNTINPETIYVRIDSPNPEVCYELAQFEIGTENCPPFVPEGFSPNGDNVNDTFEITGIKDIFDYKLFIYSRLGNLIYEGQNSDPFWDGTPNRGLGGQELPTGTYFWVLKLNTSEYQDMTGWVYLNR
jgi:gliding motility-associated-like protein